MKLFWIERFFLVANLNTENNFCALLYLAFKHYASTKSLRKLLRSRKTDTDATLLKHTHFTVIKRGKKVFEGIIRNSIACIDDLRYYVAPLAILLTIWVVIWHIVAGEKTGPSPLVLMHLYVFLLSQSLRVLTICITHDLLHVYRWNYLRLECVEAEDNSDWAFMFVEFDSILQYVVKDLFV